MAKAIYTVLKRSALDATQIIKTSWPETRVIVLTINGSYQTEAFAAGADAFFVKGPSTGDLLEAIMCERKDEYGVCVS